MIILDEDIAIDGIIVGAAEPDDSYPLSRATYVTQQIDEDFLYYHLENGYIKEDSLVSTLGIAYDSPDNITQHAEYKLKKVNTTDISQTSSKYPIITTQSLQIIVSDTDKPVDIYTINGHLIAQGKGVDAYNVSQGIYIVRTDNIAKKVIVK